MDYLAHTIRSGLKVKTSKQPDQHVPDTIIIVVEDFAPFYNKALCERLHLHLSVEGLCEQQSTLSTIAGVPAKEVLDRAVEACLKYCEQHSTVSTTVAASAERTA